MYEQSRLRGCEEYEIRFDDVPPAGEIRIKKGAAYAAPFYYAM